jgi:formamidopyrimidine-DNA glycosylase
VHDRVCWTLANGRRWIFADVRRFGILVPVELCGPGATPELLSGLGPEPLGPEFTAGYLHGLSRGRSKPVKNLLLDQRTVAGLGNIYVNETLFLARVHPARPAGRLSQGDCEQIVRSVRQVLGDAIDAGGTTISDYRTVDGSEGRFAIQLCVYGRAGEPCPRCGIEARVNRQVLGGRSTFWCPVCQR